ncbi:hypothetical protein [Methylobacterium isbiliense]|uniref:hypothetical protein n=1 Tax=Methylobacterium isbiliense TaxID=315478 RepID=UPI0025B55BD6|nr:hypothetical protein [Methylobacterium isbiliense]MDN3626867.1 hypothetical protein [Methylobacterium isbiliense]
MSGMPSMESDGDAMLWSTVAFLEKLPRMSDEAYNDLWMQAQAAGSQGGMNHGAMNMDGAGLRAIQRTTTRGHLRAQVLGARRRQRDTVTSSLVSA